MTYCCSQFEWTVSDAGNAGLSAILRDLGSDVGIGFYLQSRACDAEQEHKFQELPKNIGLPQPLRLSAQSGIKFCPYCGTQLANVIDANAESLAAIVKQHKPFELS